MIQEQVYNQADAQAAKIFTQAGWAEKIKLDHQRIEKIITKAEFQNALKDTTSFLFLGFGSAISGLSAAAFRCPSIKNIDYKA